MKTRFFVLSLAAWLLISCSIETEGIPSQGCISFSFDQPADASIELGVPVSIVIAIANTNGDIIEADKRLEVFPVENGGYTTTISTFPTGQYRLTTFFVRDADGVAIYYCPDEAASESATVEAPLPIIFTVFPDKTTNIDIEIAEIV
jgi:hypothetical protein